MATTIPMEKALFDLKDFVQANIGTYLSAIEVETADGISLPPFVVYEVGYKNLFGQRDYPRICFVPDITDFESQNQAEDIEITVDAIFALTSSDPKDPEAELTKKQLRYSDALRALISDNNSLGGKISIADVKSADYFPADPKNPKINVTIVKVKIITEEIL